MELIIVAAYKTTLIRMIGNFQQRKFVEEKKERCNENQPTNVKEVDKIRFPFNPINRMVFHKVTESSIKCKKNQ